MNNIFLLATCVFVSMSLDRSQEDVVFSPTTNPMIKTTVVRSFDFDKRIKECGLITSRFVKQCKKQKTLSFQDSRAVRSELHHVRVLKKELSCAAITNTHAQKKSYNHNMNCLIKLEACMVHILDKAMN